MKDIPVAIITGGGSGIGLAIASRFVSNNIFVVIIGRDEAKLQKAQESLGSGCDTLNLDITDLEAIAPAVQSIYEKYGRIDILVNNAGINQKKDFMEVSNDDFQTIIQTNVVSLFAMSREAAGYMAKTGKGNIINITSMAAIYGIPNVIAYTASKSAVAGMTRAMAVDLASKGIRVNDIAPGFIATDMSAKALNSDPARRERVMARTPMKALGNTDDVADAALFLASDAAKYITGVSLPVDGGNSVGF